jgi:predicted aconitase with swiveling domain
MGSVCGRTEDVNPTNMGGIIAETGQESKEKIPPSGNSVRGQILAGSRGGSLGFPVAAPQF